MALLLRRASVFRSYLRGASERSSRTLCSSANTSPALVGTHTRKWMQNLDKKSPIEYINEVPPVAVTGRVVACIGSHEPALGHPVEYICLDSDEPNVCKYCGLRYIQSHHGGH